MHRRVRLLSTAATVLTVAAGACVAPAALARATVVSDVVAAVQAGSNADWQAGQWWIDASKLRERHAAGLTGKGVNIALIDGPVFTGIPELQGQDVHPTFTTCDETSKDDGPLTPSTALNATSFHTTSMAALLVGNGKGNGPGGAGIMGVAPGATLRTYAIFNTTDPAKHQNYMCNLPVMPELIDRVVKDGADIVEIPVTLKGFTPEFTAAVNRGINKGVIFVAGAGNSGPKTIPMPPADQPGVLVVGGISPDSTFSPLSPSSSSATWDIAKRGDESKYEIHLIAPAGTILGGGVVNGQWQSNQLQNGTSGASAIVTGQLALMKQKWPKATGNQLLYSLLRNANKDVKGSVWTPRGGFGTTSFAKTLSVDPTHYPDVQPIYGPLGNVLTDQPVKPFIPEAVGADGSLPDAPPTTSAPPTTTAVPPTSAPTTAAPSASSPPRAAGQTGDTGGSSGLLIGGLAAAVVLIGALVLWLRNRRPTTHVNASDSGSTGKDL